MTYVVQELIDPQRLLIVTYQDAQTPLLREVAAVTCRYVPAIDADGHRAVAVELVYDPLEPRPSSPYFRPPQELQQLLLDPRAIRRIRPYVV